MNEVRKKGGNGPLIILFVGWSASVILIVLALLFGEMSFKPFENWLFYGAVITFFSTAIVSRIVMKLSK